MERQKHKSADITLRDTPSSMIDGSYILEVSLWAQKVSDIFPSIDRQPDSKPSAPQRHKAQQVDHILTICMSHAYSAVGIQKSAWDYFSWFICTL